MSTEPNFSIKRDGTILLPQGWDTPGVTSVFDNGHLRRVRIDKDTDLYRAMLDNGYEPDAEDDSLFTFR